LEAVKVARKIGAQVDRVGQVEEEQVMRIRQTIQVEVVHLVRDMVEDLEIETLDYMIHGGLVVVEVVLGKQVGVPIIALLVTVETESVTVSQVHQSTTAEEVVVVVGVDM